MITENNPMIVTLYFLPQENIIAFGKLMNASHQSLSVDFEVSCAELDFLAAKAQDIPQVLGARMMGNGFGGCKLNLVKTEFLEDFKKLILESYQAVFQIEPDFIAVTLSDGASVISS